MSRLWPNGPDPQNGHWMPRLAMIAAGLSLSACSAGLLSSGSESGSSFGDRFGQIFGSRSQEVGTPSPATDIGDLTCPGVSVRNGAATLAVAAPGKQAAGSDLRYQVTITRTARDCTLNGTQITARIGIQGRVIVGPAGAPPNVEIPLRVALVSESVQERIVVTKLYRTVVPLAPGDGNVPFSFVAEDMIYPAPSAGAGDNYVFYIGFDPDGVKSLPRSKKAKS